MSKTPQVDQLLAHPDDFPPKAQIANVNFVDQQAGFCGPAALSMVMNWAGKKVSADDLATEVYDSKAKGTLQNDLVGTARRAGLMAVSIDSFPSLLTEVNDGHPVIVFENLALSWFPRWHYAVVLGYDLAKGDVIMHSGHEADKVWSMKRFERSWKLADYWGLVVLPPGQVAKSAGELANLSSAAALEQTGYPDHAEVSYRKILQVWPESLGSLIGLGNIAFGKKNYARSVEYLNEAVRFHPESAVAWHNLAIADAGANLKSAARASALRALKLISESDRPSYVADLNEYVTPNDSVDPEAESISTF